MEGNRKKHVKKEQNSTNQALFGGVFLELVYRRFPVTPPPKNGWKSGTLLFFHTFFAFSSHMRPTTYPKVMIFYLKGNSMFLNTFLTILRCQNAFYRLSASRNQICLTKKRQKKNFLYVFCVFFVEQFWFLDADRR